MKASEESALLGRLRDALAGLRRVEEKRMFGGTMFMVNGKMCISARADRLMVRVDPAMHDELVARDGCTTMTMRGREYRGYIRVSESAVRTKKNFDFWVELALDYNKRVKPVARKKKA